MKTECLKCKSKNFMIGFGSYGKAVYIENCRDCDYSLYKETEPHNENDLNILNYMAKQLLFGDEE